MTARGSISGRQRSAGRLLGTVHRRRRPCSACRRWAGVLRLAQSLAHQLLQGEEEEEGRYEGYSAGGMLPAAASAAAAAVLAIHAARSRRQRPLTRRPASPVAAHLAASNPGLRPHPDPLVESASLASVPKPQPSFQHAIAEAIRGGKVRAAHRVRPTRWAGRAFARQVACLRHAQPKGRP